MTWMFTVLAVRRLFSKNVILRHLSAAKSVSCSSARCISTVESARKRTYEPNLALRFSDKTGLTDIDKFLRKQRIKGALYSCEENEQATKDFWARILKAGDMDFVERYLYMRVKLGLRVDPEKVIKDMNDAGLTPNAWTYASFIHQSCAAGDMNQTNFYLRMLRNAGFKPTRFIFSQILHGYVKAGLPEEVASTQEILSQMGLWPSKFAYEGLLSAYADIGDKDSLLRTLDEAYTVLPSIEHNKTTESRQISPVLLLDLYTRLVCSLGYTNATCSEISTKLLTMKDNFPFEFAVDTVKILLAKGRPAAALEIFKIIDNYPEHHEYLSKLALYAAAGGLEHEALEPFWHVASMDGDELYMLRNKSKLYFRRTGKFSNNLGDRLQACIDENNVQGALDLLKDLNKTNITLAYTLFVPKLMSLGISLQDLLKQTEDNEIIKALLFGYVFRELISIQSTDDLKSRLTNCSELVNEYRAKELLPYNDVVRLNSFILVKLVTNIISVSDIEEIAKLNKSTVMHDVFGIFGRTLSKRALRMFFMQVFEALTLSHLRSFHGIPKNTVIQLVADVCAHQDVTFAYGGWMLLKLRDADVPTHIMAKLSSSRSVALSSFSNINVLLFDDRASNDGRNKDEDPVTNQVKLLPEESVPATAESLVKASKNDPEELDRELKSIEKSWRLQKKFILLNYLVNLGSEDLVERVLRFLPDEHKRQLEPMKSIAHIIKSSLANANCDKPSSESVKQSIENLQNLSSQDLYVTMRGPHLDTLFRCWPTEQIPDLVFITKKLSKLGLNSVSLQLAGVLINRGLSDLVSTLLENNKTVPFTFLVGNPRNSLTKSEFLASVEYLKSVDSQHVPGFVDHCLRNAALSTNDDNFYQLIRTVVSPPFNMDLLQVCIQPTLQVLYHRLEVSKNLPEDILQAAQPVVQKFTALKAKASN
ncbi:unnamed protein product [Schistosoma rodhaini]|uniref:Pentacotripeptide-repeat region of PRORP domain-containing protein n=1 Tax=Schistosoma rodhaini TaxID=6188 RepID=A0AA85ESD9_9TREM|nr:unnamed protein product [Schistosoma rodhaini]